MSNYPIYKNDYCDELDSVDENGEITVSEDLSLGVIYDYDYAMKILLDTFRNRLTLVSPAGVEPATS